MAAEGDADARASKYMKLSQVEQVTLRSTMYVGETQPVTAQRWLTTATSDGVSVRRAEITYVPALLKLYDEVITNSLDASEKDDTVRSIAVSFEGDTIVVRNDGAGIVVSTHPKHGMPVPTMIFGELNSSSNYNANEERVVAGQNGLGVKLANIFSREFSVSIRDAATGSTFQQTWRDQMSKRGDAKIKTKDKPIAGFVEVSFTPIPSFLAPHGALNDDLKALFTSRAMDVALAARDKVRVKVGDVVLPSSTLRKYMSHFVASEDLIVGVDEQSCWKVGVAYAPDGPAVHALVNGVSASSGQHVSHVEQKLYAAIIEAAKSKKDFKNIDLKPAMLRHRIRLFVVAKVHDPSFDSQVKERCTSVKFIEQYAPSDLLVKKILGSAIVAAAAADANAKVNKQLATKTDGKKSATVNVPKLVDAVWAGGAKSAQTSLFLVEGDSARTFAVSGLSVLGHDKYGVFPLKGKPINAREASAQELMANEEVKNLKLILGLKENTSNVTELRYGAVIVLTDSDSDGSHIRGLVLNILHAKWPALAKSGYIKVLQTPIVRASKGANIRDFVNLSELNVWAGTDEARGFKLKYYKGLGTWSAADAKKLLGCAKPTTIVDGAFKDQNTDEAMELAFDEKKADARKEWILDNIAAPPTPSYELSQMSIPMFVHTDLVNYSIYSAQRALPSMLDGFKTSQRKILFTVFQRGYMTQAREVKVAQLAGAVAEKTLYLHGEASLNGAIVNMAQDFTGSNNINLLIPNGAFGTRLGNGSDAASPRYIFTYANAITRLLFHPEDDALLTHLKEEGVDVEPATYWPTLPMVLINGASGIATGFSCTVPQFNPKDVLANVLRILDGEEPTPMTPFSRGFTGNVVADGEGKWRTSGVVTGNGDVWRITEIPLDKSYNNYAKWLESDKSPVTILENRCTDTAANFKVKWKDESKVPADEAAALKALKLTESISARNMWLFDHNGKITKYASAEEILRAWVPWRLAKYEDRRNNIIAKLDELANVLASKSRFVSAVVSGKLKIQEYTDAGLQQMLAEKNFYNNKDGYAYLLNMTARSFTTDKAAALAAESAAAREKADEMKKKTAVQLWREDLDALKF